MVHDHFKIVDKGHKKAGNFNTGKSHHFKNEVKHNKTNVSCIVKNDPHIQSDVSSACQCHNQFFFCISVHVFTVYLRGAKGLQLCLRTLPETFLEVRVCILALNAFPSLV